MIERRDEELSRIYRDAEGPHPPQRVDDNIIAASQRVAGARPRPAGFGFARRWGTPFALAATVVVTFTLTLMVFERDSGLDATAPAAPRADRPAKVSQAPTTAQAAATRDRAKRRSGESGATSEPLGTGQPAFVPEVPSTSEVLRKREEAKPAPAAAPAANVYSGERSGADRQVPAQGAPELRQQTPPAPAAIPAAGALRESASAPQSAGAVSGLLRSAAVADAMERAPEKWLEDIRRLKTEGKATEAERELAEFKKRYPDYRLPEDLR